MKHSGFKKANKQGDKIMQDFTKNVLTKRVDYLRSTIKVEEENIQYLEVKLNESKAAKQRLEEELNAIESDISK